MARILLCHVPKDGSLARDLGAALMGRGHYVSFEGEPDAPRPERSSRLRQFEAVVVIWTEGSAQNQGLTSIAGETLPLNVLVPVKADTLDKTRLPLMYRKLNMFSPRDVDGIARLIARLSTAASSLRDMAEREALRRAAGAPAPGQEARAVRPLPAPRARAPERPAPATLSASAPAGRDPSRPVLEAGEVVHARPLTGLPEVAADVTLVLRPEPPPLPPPEEPALSRPADGIRVADPAPSRPAEAPSRQEDMVRNVEAARSTDWERPPQRPRQGRATVPVVTADDLARAVDAGLIVYHIPEAMWLGAPTTVELTLGRDILAGLIQAEVGHGDDVLDDRHSMETLSVSLYGSTDAFEIERQSERTQFVTMRQALAGHDPATFGRWVWLVTPRAAGAQDLIVRISALLRDSHGVPAPVALPDRRFEVDIQVPEGESLISALAGWYRR